MRTISVTVMKIIEERETQKTTTTTTTTTKQTNEDKKEQGGTEPIVKWWELNDFVVHLSCVKFLYFLSRI